ncbi:fatty acid desaturase family protein [Anaeromyxobacter diazotrophicus]|uniref:fatty acid desaturase family protein n=1 Tax=Anaeromyxobacter diazotrophicus TaxID=2590199 RepID=UPI00158F9E7A|nr:acyl-CoA desaturase [Anaeromyxobacter diazotrophicus]
MSPTPPRVRFQPDPGFHADLKRRVEAHFAACGRAPTGGPAMVFKTAVILAWFGGSYAALLAWGGASPGLAAALTLSVALATAGIGFSVMHDGNHGAYARSSRVSRAFGFALDLVGASSYLWRFKHNVQHHTYANVDGMDADVDASPFLRLAPSQPLRRHHRAQHLYAWPMYGVLAVKWWFVDDLADLLRGRIGRLPFPRPRGGELLALVAGKAVFLGWAVVVPALVFRSAWVAAFFLLGASALGAVLATVFQLAHAVPEAAFHAVTAGERRLPTGWAEHQVRATVDFARGNRVLGWYVGGLNFQVEHHLFPQVCHLHYPALAPIVEAACADHGVPYRAHATLRAALAAHHRFLRALGRAAPAAAMKGVCAAG